MAHKKTKTMTREEIGKRVGNTEPQKEIARKEAEALRTGKKITYHLGGKLKADKEKAARKKSEKKKNGK